MPHHTPDEVRSLFAEADQSEIGEQLIADARQAIAIERTDIDNEAPRLSSKFGGSPDLPPSMPWPTFQGRPLAFLAQINLSEVPRPESEPALPSKGLLSFFYDFAEQPWGFDPKDKGAALVLYHADTNLLQPTKPPAGAYADPDSGYDQPFPTSTMNFSIVTTYPEPGNALYEHEDADALIDLFGTLHEGQGEDHPRHQLLGLPLVVQNPMDEQCQLVSNGVYCGGELSQSDMQRAEELAQGVADWTLLFQMDSDANWMWGDMGLLYFWIRRQDLAAEDFSKAWCILQCG
jgi:uncharacterized protein YwqG